MSDSRMLLNDVLDYAQKNHTFNKYCMVTRARNVCVFGLGTYFREAFVSKNTKEKNLVNLLSDNDPEKWGLRFAVYPVSSRQNWGGTTT